MERESIPFDVLFVGGGPACLAGAIRLMQLAQEKGLELEVALIEKGENIGAHAVSGAILNPVALAELLPDYRQRGCPIETDVHGDAFYFLTRHKAYRLPLVPRYMHNKGYHIISQSRFTRWLGEVAEEMGIMVFSGFAGSQVLYGEDGRTVIGVRTGDKGLDKTGAPKANFEPGIDLLAKATIFGEGARGSLLKEMAPKLGLFAQSMPQVFETGIKEVLQLPPERQLDTSGGNDFHFLGYPLGWNVAGGGFLYEMGDNRLAIGYLTSLGYQDPDLDPYEAFIRFKRHPFVAGIIAGGKVIEQGARTVSAGGYYAQPQLAVGGGLFVGAAAGMQNMPALKGIHVSMKSGMLAAEAVMTAIENDDFSADALDLYRQLLAKSWLHSELYQGRNFTQALSKKGLAKLIHLGAQYVTGGRGLREALPLEDDAGTMRPRDSYRGPAWRPLDKSVYDDEQVVDKLTGVYLSKIMHREDQPAHIVVHDTDLCVTQCYPTFGSPCTRFCPGVVYEIVEDEDSGQRTLKLNPSNCFHCKTCDIKDPYGNITWTCPEGGEGPRYKLV